ncbi:hypothetical protein AX16_003021 [Volvariella volvacea WC 439]|nr:hypothetical protein AX16_003021 [Volvariella volvacea WC 439]
MQFVPRRSEDRGHSDSNGLRTFHTFSFSSYKDKNHHHFGSLRAINEDRLAVQIGYGTHKHKEFEILSYVVSGHLEHKDSMGNTKILKRGDVQLLSTGTGASYSDKAYGSYAVHLIQIWAFPATPRLQPKYYIRKFTDEDKKDKFVKIVAQINYATAASSSLASSSTATTQAQEDRVVDAKEGSGPTPIHNKLTIYAGLLSPGLGRDGSFGIRLSGKRGYVHVIQTSGYNTGKARGAGIKLRGQAGEFGVDQVTLNEGDGVYIHIAANDGELKVENVSGVVAEVLVFDIE